MSLRLLMDHHVHGAITAGLLARGIDVVTALADASNERDDDDLLMRARSLDRVLFTFDDDLLAVAARFREAGMPFSGVLFCRSREFSIGQIVDDLELVSRTLEPAEIQGQVLWLPF
jgi:predicted nuclease of predicted toxin-antitoxin system